ncbi:MAG: nitroreductase family protein [Anaerolineae bacterium]|nr:nitroreductase family protein [Anaerolineae bacterium]
MKKTAETQVPIHDLIAERWSPRLYEARPIEREKLLGLLEAARWAASSRNLQPWHFLIATSAEPDEHAKLASCLNERNRAWAGKAPVLILVVAGVEGGEHVTSNMWYDVGLAVGNLSIQAMHSGLRLRQMGGFDRALARELYHIPESYEPVVMLAIGYQASLKGLPAEIRNSELSPRMRKPLSEFVFSGTWGQASHVLGEPAKASG